MGASPKKDGLFVLFYDSRKGFYSKCCDSLADISIIREDNLTEKWSWRGLGYHDTGKAIKYPPLTENGLLIGIYDRNNDSHLTMMANDIANIATERRRGVGGCLTIASDF